MSAAHDTQFGVVERRGIELVPESERHGRPRDLFFVWVASNANVFSIVNGALLISLGLNFLQSVIVIVLGNIAGFFLLGLTSIQGPRTGTATFTINRAAFGRNGGRLLAFFNWLTLVGWDSSGVALMVIALLTLTHVVGWSIGDTTWFKVAVIVFVAAVQLYGQFLSLIIVFLAPWCAIYLTDAWLRRNTYDAAGLLARIGGPYWYQGGIPCLLAVLLLGKSCLHRIVH